MTSLTRTNPSATLVMMKDESVVEREMPRAFDWSFKRDYEEKIALYDHYISLNVNQRKPEALIYHYMAVVWDDGSQSYATHDEASDKIAANQSKISEYFRECVNPGDPETDE
jgi:hypothetical protein